MRRSIKVSRLRGAGTLGPLDSVALLLWCLGALWSVHTMLSAAAQLFARFSPGIG
jgi:hypothetical protein